MQLAEQVRRNLSVAVLPGSRILTVSFTSRDPARPPTPPISRCSSTSTMSATHSFAALTDAQSWLETHSASVQAQLDATETQLAQARAAAGHRAGRAGQPDDRNRQPARRLAGRRRRPIWR